MRNYTKDDYGWFYLDSLDEISFSKKLKIAVALENGSKVFEIEKYKKELIGILSDAEIKIIIDNYNEKKLQNMVDDTLKRKVEFITINSSEYPDLLRNTPCPPIILYYVGDVGLLKTNCITIVGSRRCTAYGKTITEDFTSELVFNNFTIVSGLAEGIDTFAHSSCLDAKGKTIAVLCGGLNTIYPSINRDLAKRIVKEGGLLISEQRLGVEGKDFMFPIRNRILAGLSLAVLLTEAGEHTGTKHTINHAIDANRNVYCIPHSILNSRGVFGNYLIKTNQASLVTEPRDIIEDLGFECKSKLDYNENLVKLEIDEYALVREILSEDEYVHIDKILEKSKMDIKKLNTLLTKMELSGIIKKMAGNYYMLSK